MPDEFDIVHLSEDDAQQIIDWAVATGAMLHLAQNSPRHANVQEAIERLEDILEAIDMGIDTMPEALVVPSRILAKESIRETLEEEQQVDEFRRQLEDL